MAEIVNLKRVKKQKARAEKSAAAEANRAKHGTAQHLRDAGKAAGENAARRLEGHKLDDDKD